MDDPNEDATPLGSFESEIKELLGLFDVPAFARRGYELEYALIRLRTRLESQRQTLLEMVQLRLRQWAAAATGPDLELRTFAQPIASLWPLTGSDPPRWASRSASSWKLRGIAKDLIASVERFNRRWSDQLDRVDLGPINKMVDDYNRYYLLEKECSLGSARLAARNFAPKIRVQINEIRDEFPPLPVPALKA